MSSWLFEDPIGWGEWPREGVGWYEEDFGTESAIDPGRLLPAKKLPLGIREREGDEMRTAGIAFALDTACWVRRRRANPASRKPARSRGRVGLTDSVPIQIPSSGNLAWIVSR